MKFKALLLFIIFILMVCPGLVWSDEFRLIPSLTVIEKYNDNIFLSATDRERDWVTVLSPGLELVNRTERFDINLKARLDDIRYKDLRDFDADDQFYSGRVRYTVTNRLTLGANAGFTKDSQPDRDIYTTGLVLSMGKRESQTYGTFLSYRLHELTTATVSYKYDAARFDRVEQTDQWNQGVTLNLDHDFNKWVRGTKGRLKFDYAHYHFQGNVNDNYTATIGFSHDFSEKWSLLMDVGGHYTRSSIDVLSEERNNQSWGTVGQLSMAYKDIFTTGNVAVTKEIAPASGYNSAVDRTLVSFNLRRRFTQEFQGFVTGGYSLNKSDSGEYAVQGIDERSMNVRAGVRYDFTRDIFLEASYENVKNWHGDDTQADRNLFLMKFYIQHSFFDK